MIYTRNCNRCPPDYNLHVSVALVGWKFEGRICLLHPLEHLFARPHLRVFEQTEDAGKWCAFGNLNVRASFVFIMHFWRKRAVRHGDGATRSIADTCLGPGLRLRDASGKLGFQCLPTTLLVATLPVNQLALLGTILGDAPAAPNTIVHTQFLVMVTTCIAH